MSALGQKQTLKQGVRDVRFAPKSRHAPRRRRCLLSARSGHRLTVREWNC